MKSQKKKFLQLLSLLVMYTFLFITLLLLVFNGLHYSSHPLALRGGNTAIINIVCTALYYV